MTSEAQRLAAVEELTVRMTIPRPANGKGHHDAALAYNTEQAERQARAAIRDARQDYANDD